MTVYRHSACFTTALLHARHANYDHKCGVRNDCQKYVIKVTGITIRGKMNRFNEVPPPFLTTGAKMADQQPSAHSSSQVSLFLFFQIRTCLRVSYH